MRNKLVYIVLGLLSVVVLLTCCAPTPTPREKAPRDEMIDITSTLPKTQEKVEDDSTIESVPTLALLPEEEFSDVVPSALPTSPPPLAKVEFPMEEIDYPPDYPAELRYPEQLTLVDTESGPLPGTDSDGWVARLRYEGSPKEAAGILATFFTTNGWQAQRLNLDSGGYMLLVERNNKQHTGGLIIDPDTNNPDYTLILATVRF